MLRIRIHCIMLPEIEFAEDAPPSMEHPDGVRDGVVVCEIDPADLSLLLCTITPMQIKSPIQANVCRNQGVVIAG